MGGTFVVGAHHLARCLASLGHRVFHLSTPVTPFHLVHWGDPDIKHRFRNWFHDGEKYCDDLIDYVPLSLVPKQIAHKVSATRSLFLASAPPIHAILRRYDFTDVDVLLVDQPYFVGLERIVNPRVLGYRATDLYVELLGKIAVEVAEKDLVNGADFLIGTSQPVIERLRSLAPGKPLSLLENGVDYKLFSTATVAPPEYSRILPPRFVYAGALDERFGFDVVRAVAFNFPMANIILIGPYSASSFKRLGSSKNVHVLGPRKHEQLPGYFQHADIGLLPFSDHLANDGRSPMKLFEYGASGLPVVATRTTELARRKLDFVFLANDANDFVCCVDKLIDNGNEISRIRATAKDQSKAYAWETITHRLVHDVWEVHLKEKDEVLGIR